MGDTDKPETRRPRTKSEELDAFDQDNFRQTPDLFDRLPVRIALFVVIPALVFVLVSAGIRVSQYGIDHTILVYGDKVLVSDRPAAVRVSLMADDGRFFLPERLTGHLVQKGGKGRHRVFDGAVSDRGQAIGREFQVPKIPAGAYVLELDIWFDKKRRIVRTDVTVKNKPPKEKTEVPEDTHLDAPVARVQKGDIAVQGFTEDRGAPTGIHSDVFVRTLDKKGKPVSTPLNIKIADAKIPIAKKTNQFGLARLEVRPAALDIPLEVEGAVEFDTEGNSSKSTFEKGGRGDFQEKEKSDKAQKIEQQDKSNTETPTEGDAGAPPAKPDASIKPNVVYSGLSATVETPIAKYKEPITVSMEQVASGGPIYADLFLEGRYVKASSGWLKGSEAAMDVKLEISGLFRLQLATSAIGAGHGVAVRHFYVLAKDESPVEGIKTILKQLESSEVDGKWAKSVAAMDLKSLENDAVQELAAFALSRLYKGHRHVDNIVSSRKEDDAELNAFKATFQRSVMLAIMALGLAVSLLIGLFALSAFKKQQRISQMILSDLDDPSENPEWVTADGFGHTKGRLILQGAILFFIILGAFISIALLVDTISWGS